MTPEPIRRKNFFAALLCLLLAMGSSMASASSPARITAAVDPARRTTLSTDLPKRLSSYTDQGPVAASQSMTHVYMVLQRSSEQQKAFETYLQQLQQKSSPNYHQWLTPSQIGERYGVATSDLTQITSWLASNGLKVDHVSSSRMLIDFSGTAAQIESAFQVSLRRYTNGTQNFTANSTAPTIPAAFASVVHGLARLNTYKPHSYLKQATGGLWNPATKRLEPATSSTASSTAPRAQLTYTDSSGTHYLYVTPADAATIYNTPNPTLNPNYTATKYDGSGITIAIGGDADIDTSYVKNYRTRFLGDSTEPTQQLVGTDPSSTSDATEAYLDLEVAGGLAPGAKLIYYYSSDLLAAVLQAVEDNKADIVSLSFGGCEQSLGDSYNTEINEIWSEAAAAGIAVTVSTGDAGSAGCDDENSETTAQDGLAVNGLASTPYNIAVGGTDYDVINTNYTQYADTTNAAANYYRTALGYIPENPWNDSPNDNQTWEQNTPYYSSSQTNIVGGGGGKSSCASTKTGSCVGYTKPLWQRGETVVGDGVRDLPDVSLLAANGSYGATWLICVPGSDCSTDASTGKFTFAGVGGTSASTPAFAGILAVLQQAKGGTRLGQAAATLYDLGSSSSSYSTVFHDVTVGNNSVPCVQNSTDCTLNSAGFYFLAGYDAATGYDLASGLGSIDTVQMISAWSSASSPLTPTLTVTPSTSTLAAGNSLTVTVQVQGDGASTPTGTVTLTAGSYSSAATTLNNGQATITIQPGDLASGTDTVAANYSGDAVYGSGSRTTTITVSKSNTVVTASASASSYTPTDAASLTVTVAGGTRAPSGNVTLTAGSYSNTLSLSNGTATFDFAATVLNPGPNTLTVSYAGDAYYNGSSATTTVELTHNTATITITPSTTASYTGQALTVGVAVGGIGVTPTGTVMLTAGSYTSTSTTLASGAATFTIPANSLAAGNDAITATYSGDVAYAAQMASTSVTVTSSSFTATAANSTLTVASTAGTTSVVLNFATTSGYTGTINLSCALSSSPAAADASHLPTCTIPASVSLSSATPTATATLTIHSTVATSAAVQAPSADWRKGGSPLALAGLLLIGLYRRARRFRSLLAVLALALLCGMGLSACGGTTKTPVAGTSPGSYSFTVTATDSANPALTTTTTINTTIL